MILFLPLTTSDRDPIRQRQIRPIAAEVEGGEVEGDVG